MYSGTNVSLSRACFNFEGPNRPFEKDYVLEFPVFFVPQIDAAPCFSSTLSIKSAKCNIQALRVAQFECLSTALTNSI